MKDRVLSIYVTCLVTRDVDSYNVVYRGLYWTVYMGWRLQVKWKQKEVAASHHGDHLAVASFLSIVFNMLVSMPSHPNFSLMVFYIVSRFWTTIFCAEKVACRSPI